MNMGKTEREQKEDRSILFCQMKQTLSTPGKIKSIGLYMLICFTSAFYTTIETKIIEADYDTLGI